MKHLMPKVTSLVSSITRSTRNLSTQNSLFSVNLMKPSKKITDFSEKSQDFSRKNTADFSGKNEDFSRKNLDKNNKKNFVKKTENSRFGGLLKHRKLMENAKIGSLTDLKALGFSYSKGDVNCKDLCNNSALFYAAERGLSDFCGFLLRIGADPNEKCADRNTPFHMAFKSGKMEVISEIMKHGGDLNARNKDGDSPRKFGNGRVMKEFDLKLMVSFV